MDEVEYCYSVNEVDYYTGFTTREEALAEARAHADDSTVYTAIRCEPQIEDGNLGDDVLETVEMAATDLYGDIALDWTG